MEKKAGNLWNCKSVARDSDEISATYLFSDRHRKILQEQVRQAFLTRFEVSKDDLNFASFDMEREPLDLVIQEAQSLPFFGDQRLIFVERPFSNSRKSQCSRT